MSHLDRWRDSGNLPSQQEVVVALGLGLVSALPYVMPIGILTLLLKFLPNILLFLSFLCYGKRCGALSSLTVMLAVVLVGSNGTLINILCFSLLPSATMGFFLMRKIVVKGKTWWYPEGFVFRHLLQLAVFLVLLLSMTIYPEEFVRKQAEEIVKVLFHGNLPAEKQFFEFYSKCFVGLAVLSNLLGVAFDLLIADNVGRRLKMNLRPKIDLLHLSITPQVAVFPLVAMATALLLPSISQICCGLAIVGLMGPLLAGFSIIHFLADRQNNRNILYTFYGLLLLLFPAMILLAIFVGIADSFYAIRPASDAVGTRS
ncbi:MAG: hypothetical protein LBJ16_04335 [Holosporaceae bacterium]|jgi:hypothetical protein|nr:hypothetical protein [Holosporaceae bacterium]